MNIRNDHLFLRIFIIILFSILPLITIIQSIPVLRWSNIAVALFMIISNLSTLFIYNFFKGLGIRLPIIFDIIYLSFLFTSTYLGSAHKFYERFGWWDMAIHTSAGLIFVPLGFYIVSLLNLKKIINTTSSLIFEAYTAFNLSISVTCLWELFEYLSDVLFKTNLMGYDILDTMSDILLGTLGTILASIYFYYKRKKHIKNMKGNV
jgi:putative membrane protein